MGKVWQERIQEYYQRRKERHIDNDAYLTLDWKEELKDIKEFFPEVELNDAVKRRI